MSRVARDLSAIWKVLSACGQFDFCRYKNYSDGQEKNSQEIQS